MPKIIQIKDILFYTIIINTQVFHPINEANQVQTKTKITFKNFFIDRLTSEFTPHLKLKYILCLMGFVSGIYQIRKTFSNTNTDKKSIFGYILFTGGLISMLKTAYRQYSASKKIQGAFLLITHFYYNIDSKDFCMNNKIESLVQLIEAGEISNWMIENIINPFYNLLEEKVKTDLLKKIAEDIIAYENTIEKSEAEYPQNKIEEKLINILYASFLLIKNLINPESFTFPAGYPHEQKQQAIVKLIQLKNPNAQIYFKKQETDVQKKLFDLNSDKDIFYLRNEIYNLLGRVINNLKLKTDINTVKIIYKTLNIPNNNKMRLDIHIEK